MSGEPCPVCGHVEGACGAGNGHQRTSGEIITSKGVVSARPMLPIQRTRFGRHGYVGQDTGQVDVYDRDYPKVPLVQHAPALEVDEDSDTISTETDEARRLRRLGELGKSAGDTLSEADVAYIEAPDGTGTPSAAVSAPDGGSGGSGAQTARIAPAEAEAKPRRRSKAAE